MLILALGSTKRKRKTGRKKEKKEVRQAGN